MIRRTPYYKFFLPIIIISIAATFRLKDLAKRPMHTDEAVHAVKFGMLLEEGYYRYDPNEYHGPTLNYFTLIPVWLSSIHKFVDVQETTLRIVPAFFGIVLVLLTWFLVKGLGNTAVYFSAFFTAISPAMVFYSRYYIQEILFICFIFGFLISVYRYLEKPSIPWAISAGLFLGLMHATKETFVIFLFAMLLSLGLLIVTQKDFRHQFFRFIKSINIKHVLIFILSSVIISVLFFSSFFTNLKGIIDSVAFLGDYLQRGSGTKIHFHPWYYYLRLIFYSKMDSGPVWSEGFILFWAIVGVYASFSNRIKVLFNKELLKFITFYTIILTFVFSAIPYKTPWNILGFLHGYILLAGIGISFIWQLVNKKVYRIIFFIFLFLGFCYLMLQSIRAIDVYCASPLNPYVYSHPDMQIYDLIDQVDEIVRAQPEGNNIYIEVIYPESNYWPLPWYFRKYPNVGWWDHVEESIPAAPIILIAPELESALIHKLYELPPPGKRDLYIPLFENYFELRPGAEIRGYVRKDVWDRYYYNQTSSSLPLNKSSYL